MRLKIAPCIFADKEIVGRNGMARTPETETDPAPAKPVTVDRPEWAGVYWTAIEWLHEP